MGSYSRPDGVGRYFGVDNAQCIQLVPLQQTACQWTELTRTIPNGSTSLVNIPAQNAYFLMIYLEDVLHCDVASNGVRSEIRRYERGSACLVDLDMGASIELYSSLKAVACVLPRALFNEIAESFAVTVPHRLICKRGEPDDVLANLGPVLVSFFAGDASDSLEGLKHLSIAICAHLLHHYSEKTLRNGQMNTTLSVWQEKAAKEFMLENLGRQVSVAEIAAIAGLSANHFAHEFKKATGFTPSRWLTHMRIDHAKGLLAESRISLAVISDRCGFTDQSHFTKVFSRETGMTPIAWRSTPVR